MTHDDATKSQPGAYQMAQAVAPTRRHCMRGDHFVTDAKESGYARWRGAWLWHCRGCLPAK